MILELNPITLAGNVIASLFDHKPHAAVSSLPNVPAARAVLVGQRAMAAAAAGYLNGKASHLSPLPETLPDLAKAYQAPRESFIAAPSAQMPATPNTPTTSAQAEEIPMAAATSALTPASVATGWIRFIDAIGSFFHHAAPIIEGLAVAAEPFLALSPFGPEYQLVVNAIIGAKHIADASLAAGTGISGTQKMALVVEATTPALTTILRSKGIVSNIPAAISQFAQNVYNLQTGPTTTVPPTAVAPTPNAALKAAA